MENFFETTDPRGVEVYLSKRKWDEHISIPAGHLSTNQLPEVRETVEKPNEIWTTASTNYPNREVYFRERTNSTSTKTRYSKVVIDRSGTPAWVVTAFVVPIVSGNIKERIYAKDKL